MRRTLGARLALLAFAVFGSVAGAQQRDAYVAYVYPAGGQAGTTFRVTVAGQYLKGADMAIVSGSGVRASVVDYVGASGLLSSVQEEALRQRIDALVKAKSAPQAPAGSAPASAAVSAEAADVALPDLPELDELEKRGAKELRLIYDRFINRDSRPKAPMNETVELEVAIDPKAAPGERELRIVAASGVSNPLVFCVGTLPEARERGRFDLDPPAPAPLAAPIVLNGQIFPGEVDSFPLTLAAGQEVALKVAARALVPYLADAVPGWFQPVLSVRDPDGDEIAYADDNGSDPDPVLRFTAPRGGVYAISIRDAIYRGRFDFVYRIEARPADPAAKAAASMAPAKTPTAAGWERETGWSGAAALPSLVSGTIFAPGEAARYRFAAAAGDAFVAEIRARRDGSPLDASLALLDPSGKQIAFNDDFEDKEAGLLTQQVDPYLRCRIPAAGVYTLVVAEVTRRGGPEYAYRLRAGPAAEDFAVLTDRSAINIPLTGSASFSVLALRKDGFEGDIELALKRPMPGLSLEGGIIPKGKTVAAMTLSFKGVAPSAPFPLELEARAMIGGKPAARPVKPADRMMQAFANFHYVQADALYAGFWRGRGKAVSVSYPAGGSLRIPAGGTAELEIILAPRPADRYGTVTIELADPPAGLTVREARPSPKGFILILAADSKLAGFSDTIVARAKATIPARPADKQGKTQNIDLGCLPAFSVEVFKP
ncbi:hypothetical protein LWX53_01130 [bacterium]|nr:hypothetical protein [bacterium]